MSERDWIPQEQMKLILKPKIQVMIAMNEEIDDEMRSGNEEFNEARPESTNPEALLS